MENNGNHYVSQVERIGALTSTLLCKALNEFYENRFIVATQVWAPVQSGEKYWIAIVYFKVPPEQQA